MTALEKARKFIGNKGSRIALTIVPLAGLAISAVPAKAAQIGPSFTFSGGNCTPSASNDNSGGASPITSGTCGVTAYTQPGGTQNGGNATTAYTNGGGVTVTATQSGSYSLNLYIPIYSFGNTGFNPELPINWVFDVVSNGFSSATYDLNIHDGYGGDSGGDSFDTGPVSLSFSGGVASVTGSGSIEYFTNMYMSLTIDGTLAGSGSSFTLQVPGATSIDLNEEQSATPEPASVATGAMGLAALFLARLRRRKV